MLVHTWLTMQRSIVGSKLSQYIFPFLVLFISLHAVAFFLALLHAFAFILSFLDFTTTRGGQTISTVQSPVS